MKHLGTKQLETKRLLLRPFMMDDAAAMHQNWAGDPEVTKYLTWPAHESVSVSAAILSDWQAQYAQADYYQWAIVLKEEGADPIGSISVVKQDDATEIVQIGYCIGRRWLRRGITSEAFERVIAFFFREVGVSRIESVFDAANENSGKVMEKCGLVYEGRHRQAAVSNQGRYDAIIHAMLRDDYGL